MTIRYRRKEYIQESVKLFTQDDIEHISSLFKESRYLKRNLDSFITDFFIKHNLDQYYGYKMDMRRYLTDNKQEILKQELL